MPHRLGRIRHEVQGARNQSLDGTLLVGERIPADNIVAVRAARDAGLKIIIATARWHQMALRVANELEIAGPVIACSGAQVHLADEDRDIFDERLPEDFVAELYKLCDGERCVATVTVADRVLLKLDGEPDRSVMLPEMSWVRQLAGARIRCRASRRFRAAASTRASARNSSRATETAFIFSTRSARPAKSS